MARIRFSRNGLINTKASSIRDGTSSAKKFSPGSKQLGWIPADAELTPRDPTMPSWDSIPESERAFQSRLMEIYAGFCEHTDAQVGKLINGLEQLGFRDNTIIFYVWGDNGSSAEGQNGTISELLAQNEIPNTVAQQIKALDELGGLKDAGRPADRQHVSRRLGLVGLYALPWHQIGRLPLRRHTQPAGRFLAGEHPT